MQIIWQIDYLKISHLETGIVSSALDEIDAKYGKMIENILEDMKLK